MKDIVFEGCATALVTPYDEGGIDFASLGRLIERQGEAGVSAVVLAGTTGEAATLSEHEWEILLSETVRVTGGRVPVIVGVGSNSTARAVELAKRNHALPSTYEANPGLGELRGASPA